ncbi:MAG TPA: IgGFc-binding protein [Polyangiaceae bacterium]|jgi:hypothetical protein|nr:IgGFc-binding protein [Polyangiaceae bacterium]
MTKKIALLVLLAACGGDDNGQPDASGPQDTGAADNTVQDAGGSNDSGLNFGDVTLSLDTGTTSPIPTTCTEAVQTHSYIGCDYFPTVTLNPVYSQFDFAVAVSNPQATQVVTVTVTGGALAQSVTVQVQPQSVTSIPLPWVAALKGPQFDVNTVVSDPGPSRIVPKGAYHLSTDFPVSVYQFSALEYEIDAGAPCPGYGDAGAGPHCYSYSNDASLLLPTNVATGDYGVVGWPSFGATPGFFTVTATQDNTHVTVYPAGQTQGVPDAGPAVMVRGDSYTYALNQGDVLEMFSALGDVLKPVYASDLSGSIIQADKPIMTFAGHGCTFIPENKRACDHLESSMFPVEVLGTQFIATLPHTPHGEHVWVRIMGLYDSTLVGFDPPIMGYQGALLNTGDVMDIPDVDQSFAIVANGRVNVVEYLQGEYANWPADAGTPNPDEGDPSECPAVPLQQYRSTYTFLAPKTYAENWIDVITPVNNTVTLDGTDIPQNLFVQVGGQPFYVAHMQLSNTQEGHEIHGVFPFGLYVYGYGSRTSYMYPGGLDLHIVSIPPPPPVK